MIIGCNVYCLLFNRSSSYGFCSRCIDQKQIETNGSVGQEYGSFEKRYDHFDLFSGNFTNFAYSGSAERVLTLLA